jgi:hypothetical protein
MIYRILLFFYLFVSFKYSAATTFTTSQDGDWEDSSSWNSNQNLSHTLNGDTIIIAHNINFNHALIFSNCYIRIDTLGSLCGHDSISLYSSIVYQYGGSYAQMLLLFSSKWLCYYGYWIFISDSFWYEGLNWEFGYLFRTAFGMKA